MNVRDWVLSSNTNEPTTDAYCRTRDVVQAKVESSRSVFTQHSWSDSTTALITAVLGELTSNAFDHNLGQWPDTPGCWFEYHLDQSRLIVTIADRGQGVHSSLLKVRPGIDDHEALRIAFSEHVTGRAPEKRGNGLKFVMNVLRSLDDVTFTYQSGRALLSYSTKVDQKREVSELLTTAEATMRGVYLTLEIKRPL